MKLSVLIGAMLLCWTGAVDAAEPSDDPSQTLLPGDVVRTLIAQDPAVMAAQAGLRVAREGAGILEASPYEWTPSASAQRRSADGAHYNEWNVGVDRTIRLPGKAAADRDLAGGMLDEARARYLGEIHASAKLLMTLWIDWLAAEQGLELSIRNVASARSGMVAVERRVKAGDASKLDLNLVQGELAEQRRLESEARTLAAAAWSRLSARFPGIERRAVPLPQPVPVPHEDAFWRERILEVSEDLRVLRTQLSQSQAAAARARAERIPDPTVGLFTASERGGAERYWGVRVSIPLPGGQRSMRSSQAAAGVDVSFQGLELKRRQLEAEVSSTVTSAKGAYDVASMAREAASSLRGNATLTQKAYGLGELDLQSLLLSRRQELTAANSALQAQATALKAYYGLMIDAHLIWDMDKD